MTCRRIALVLMAVLFLLTAVPTPIFAASSSVLSLSGSLAQGEQPALGDTITYTVAITENEGGFVSGMLFFLASAGLTYESATLLGEEYPADVVQDGGVYDGAYVISWATKERYTDETEAYCTINFRVTAVGDLSLTVAAEQFIDDTLADVAVTVAVPTVTYTVKTPEKPQIATDWLTDAVLNQNYAEVIRAGDTEFLTFEIVSGRLPAGVDLLSNGMLSGVPIEVGSFSFSVSVTIAGVVTSDPQALTLNVLEKPKRLELQEQSTYAFEEELYLVGVTERTVTAELVAQFRHPDCIRVFSASGSELAEDAYIGTGCTVSLMDGEIAVHTVTVVVLGDTDGSGRIGSLDYVNIRMHYLNMTTLTGAYGKAADVDKNGRIGSLDYMNVRMHYLNMINIYASGKVGNAE